MINLRHLILCNDVDSASSPLEILDEWRSIIKINILNASDFPKRKINETFYKVYEERQKQCFRRCIRIFENDNRKWALFIDPDEYLTFNTVSEDDNKCIFDRVSNNHQRNDRSNITSPARFKVVYNENKDLKKCKKILQRKDNKTLSMSLWKRRLKLPTNFYNSITIAEYMQQTQHLYPWSGIYNCIMFPRLQFGSKKEKNEKLLSKYIPPEFHAKNFTTLSIFSTGEKNNFLTNKWGKCLLDLTNKTVRIIFKSPHYMSPGCGGQENGFIDHDYSLLRINHYVGSYESFFLKNDTRRTKEVNNINMRYSFIFVLKYFVSVVFIVIACIDTTQDVL